MENEILKNVEIIISDVDGVWTDGGMYYSNKGIELKKFSVYDGGAIELLKIAKIPIIILTGEKNKILKHRFLKLKINDFRLGIQNKRRELNKIAEKYNVKNENILFIGDFINDCAIMKGVGIRVCPLNACEEIKKLSNLMIKKNGGEGVLWNLTKMILKTKNIYNNVMKIYFQSIEKNY